MPLKEPTPEDVAKLAAHMRRNGFVKLDHRGEIVDLTRAGRQWLRGLGINVPDDKSLLWLGLEVLVEEVCIEGMEAAAGRTTHSA